MRKLHITYFAILREQSGRSEETVDTAAATAREFYEELRARHRFSLPVSRLRVAVNGEFASWDTTLADGQRIAFIPPVAGG
jgi:molybdopterin converting factor subunit 1